MTGAAGLAAGVSGCLHRLFDARASHPPAPVPAHPHACVEPPTASMLAAATSGSSMVACDREERGTVDRGEDEGCM